MDYIELLEKSSYSHSSHIIAFLQPYIRFFHLDYLHAKYYVRKNIDRSLEQRHLTCSRSN